MGTFNKMAKCSNLSSEEINQKQREWFIDYWVNYMMVHSDEEWSKQQNDLINSILQSAKQWSREEFLELKSKL